MQQVFVISSNILSPLGLTTEENFTRLLFGESAVKRHLLKNIHEDEIWASLFSEDQLKLIKAGIKNAEQYSKFESLLISSAQEALEHTDIDPSAPNTVFICSTTKGSISEIENGGSGSVESLELFSSAKKLSEYFNNPNDPIVISNACISGLAALIVAERMLKAGQFENAIVVGADTIGPFVYSGFHSFQALSPGRCKPFSADRDGINLGEAAGTIILSSAIVHKDIKSIVRIGSGSMSNDANHISGPSRTGEELGMAIRKSMKANSLISSDIGLVSAHGTATLYNDEMEAKAIHYSGLEDVPLISLKGYFGHTLGAAGLIESIISIESMKKGIILASAGFSKEGLLPIVNICKEVIEKEYQHCLKIASGFGGCNAAIVYSKN